MKNSELSRVMAEIARRGAKKRLAKISPQRRKEIAEKAAQARWKKEKKDKNSVT